CCRRRVLGAHGLSEDRYGALEDRFGFRGLPIIGQCHAKCPQGQRDRSSFLPMEYLVENGRALVGKLGGLLMIALGACNHGAVDECLAVLLCAALSPGDQNNLSIDLTSSVVHSPDRVVHSTQVAQEADKHGGVSPELLLHDGQSALLQRQSFLETPLI